jgi:cytoskeletal protein RodZ
MTNTDKMSSYGLYLQSLRVEKGISIEQVAAETRIRAEILRAIEGEDHENLPDDVFVKGFLRSFAKVIGADQNEVLRRFDSRRKVQMPATVLSSIEPSREGRLWLTLLWVALLMAGLVGGTFLIYQLVYQRSETDARQAQVTRETEAAEPVAQPVPEAAQAEAAQPGAAKPEPAQPKAAQPLSSAEEVKQENAAGTEASRYKMEIVCDENTWIKVIVDDAPAEEYFLKPGDRLQLAAKNNYNLLIGNAGGVSVQLDGQPVPVPGKSGDVVNLQLP